MKPIWNERGLTLVEFTIVAALGAVVMLTISSFYLTSQSLWLDSSLQAVAQRDATIFAGEIGRRIEAAVQVDICCDGTQISLYSNPNDPPTAEIRWNPGEAYARIFDYAGSEERITQWPATGRLKSLRFRLEGANPRIVYMDSLRIETPAGEQIYLSSAFGLYNHP
jgi:Flp pilus assembly pilin Flp